jgi:hypothetical protein
LRRTDFASGPQGTASFPVLKVTDHASNLADRLMISHPDKILFPEDGITKGELAYYEMIAP